MAGLARSPHTVPRYAPEENSMNRQQTRRWTQNWITPTRLRRPLEGVALLAAFACAVSAQQPAGTLLVIEVESETFYIRDVGDPAQFGANPNPVDVPATVLDPMGRLKTFMQGVAIGDIVSVNGKRVRGAVVVSANWFMLRPQPSTGQADMQRGGLYHWHFEILDESGRPIGTIQANGTSGGPPPPGSPRQFVSGNHVVAGGTGAFLGARGQLGGLSGDTRSASITEDPLYRRRNFAPAGVNRYGIYVIPMVRPEIVPVAGGPAIVHSGDYSLVSAAKPARSGEVLTLFASGLGPTRPGVDSGQPFTAGQVCNSPIEVMVNGRPGEVLYAGGYPGAVDRYQVNFRVPDGTASGPLRFSSRAPGSRGPR
jgi:hypothetical protein